MCVIFSAENQHGRSLLYYCCCNLLGSRQARDKCVATAKLDVLHWNGCLTEGSRAARYYLIDKGHQARGGKKTAGKNIYEKHMRRNEGTRRWNLACSSTF